MTKTELYEYLQDNYIVEEFYGTHPTRYRERYNYVYYKQGRNKNLFLIACFNERQDDPFKINFTGKWYKAFSLKGSNYRVYKRGDKIITKFEGINIVSLI